MIVILDLPDAYIQDFEVSILPRVGEIVWYGGKQYDVKAIGHSFDEDKVTVNLRAYSKW